MRTKNKNLKKAKEERKGERQREKYLNKLINWHGNRKSATKELNANGIKKQWQYQIG